MQFRACKNLSLWYVGVMDHHLASWLPTSKCGYYPLNRMIVETVNRILLVNNFFHILSYYALYILAVTF